MSQPYSTLPYQVQSKPAPYVISVNMKILSDPHFDLIEADVSAAVASGSDLEFRLSQVEIVKSEFFGRLLDQILHHYAGKLPDHEGARARTFEYFGSHVRMAVGKAQPRGLDCWASLVRIVPDPGNTS